jgi:hypothetical protein
VIGEELVAMRKHVTDVADVFHWPAHLQVGVIPLPLEIALLILNAPVSIVSAL